MDTMLAYVPIMVVDGLELGVIKHFPKARVLAELGEEIVEEAGAGDQGE